jgi:two-component system, NarL family, sensor kinase
VALDQRQLTTHKLFEGGHVQSHRPFRSFSSPTREVRVSRLLAVVVAACLVTAATTQLLAPGAAFAGHASQWVMAVTYTLLGLRVVAHAPRNAVGWLTLVMGLCSALTIGASAMAGWFVPAWVSVWVWWPSYALLPVVGLVFPAGRLTSARWRPVLVVAALGLVLPMIGIGWASWSSPVTFWDDAVAGTATRGLPVAITVVGVLCLFVGLLGSLLSLVFRWLRAPRDERRLLAWAVACTALLAPALLVDMRTEFWGAWGIVIAAFLVTTLVPILRYGLYNVDMFVHRSVLFGLVAVILAGAYTVTVMVFTSPPTPGDVMGTVAVVLLLAPLYRWLRALLDRWLFGDGADPYRALSRLGEQLENLLQPDEVLKAIAHSVGTALKLPYVAVRVDSLHATSGVSREWPQFTIPLRYDGDDMGALVVEARAPEDAFERHERRLLVDLARQAALAARSARLAKELQRVGEEHVEDLKYITGEVHDNVAPGVAAVRLQVDALCRTPVRADLGRRLTQIGEDLTSVLGDIRQVVRSVRPHGLHAGLVETVRRRAAKFTSEDLTVTITPVGTLDRLPASVEDEAYRIVSAALANVAEHAGASTCEVRLVQDAGQLEITVVDDGAGISPDVVPGIGLDSMRNRCERRGGSFRTEPLCPGTRVVAVLPVEDTAATQPEGTDGR